MNKTLKIIIALVCVVFIVVGGVFALCYNGVFVTDHSAIIAVEGMHWNNKTYSPIGGEYTLKRRLAKSENGWDIYEIKGDKSHNFVVASSFLDSCLYVADDYKIHTDGELTSVCWNGRYISNKEFINALSQIDSNKITTFDYETDAIWARNDNQIMKPVYFAYENCPVATVSKGYMGKINGEWVITTYISHDMYKEDGSPKVHKVGCYSIPTDFADVLEKYFLY